MKVLLDSGVLALLVSPIQDMSEAKENEIYQCTEWFYSLLSKGVFILASEISDYEVRRELIRINVRFGGDCPKNWGVRDLG